MTNTHYKRSQSTLITSLTHLLYFARNIALIIIIKLKHK